MFYDHEKEIIYNRTYENGSLEESNCCPTGCVAAMIYYVNSYENDPETFKKDILIKNYNKIKTALEDNTCFVETKVTEIVLENLF
jgi:diaminopimelate epimerase